MNLGYVIGSVGYIFVMLILYFFGFNEAESMGLVCYERYMSAMLFPMVMIACIYLIAIILRRSKYDSSIVLAVGMGVLLIGGVSRTTFEENIVPGIICENISNVFIGDATIINENTQEDDKVYIICQGDIGGDRNIIAYLSSPRRFNVSYYTVSEEDKEIMLDKLKGYDYLFLSNIDEVFINSYSDLFSGETLENQQLYKINKEVNEYTFERVY